MERNHLEGSSMTARQRLVVILGLAISAVFLALAFYDLHPEDVWGYIQRASAPLLIAAAIWYFASVIVIALRWQYLLRATKRVSLGTLFRLVCISYMGNNVYPLRGGEMLRIVLLQRSDRVPIATSSVVVIVERVFDGLVMLTFVIVSLLLLDVNSPELRTIAVVTTPIFVVALLVFFALALKPNLLRRLVEFFSRFLPGRLRDLVLRLAEEVIVGLEGLRTPADLIGTVISSYISWMLEATVYWIVADAFGLHTPFAAMLLVIGVINLAGLIPASPGGFGIFEYMTVLALSALGYDKTLVTAFAVSAHLVIWLPVTLLGFYYLIRRGLGLDAVAHVERLEKEAAL
jgi:uncharacterized protein (TIRG00374 family)